MDTKAPKTTLRDRIGTAEPETSPAPATLTPPLPGEYWHGQGGYYAGIIHNPENGARWHLIMAPGYYGPAAWGNVGEKFEGSDSFYDGLANTESMRAGVRSHPILHPITKTAIEGHSDYYLPALRELNLLCVNLISACNERVYWSSTKIDKDYAWDQDYEDGFNYFHLIDSAHRALAVRRIPIQ